MSQEQQHSKDNAKGSHGTLKSYIAGFILSLFFTINAYFLVVTKSLSGTTLAATILVFAILQMAVQIFFFLHLGRGPKPLYNVVFFFGTAGLILVVVLGSIFIINNLHYNMTGPDVTKKLAQDESIYQVDGAKTGACQTIYANHKVTILNGKVSPLHTDARLCDTLSFINMDAQTLDIAFGPHTQNISYGGETEITVHKNYPKTITLNQSGTYPFRDHIDPGIAGDFTVTQ